MICVQCNETINGFTDVSTADDDEDPDTLIPSFFHHNLCQNLTKSDTCNVMSTIRET